MHTVVVVDENSLVLDMDFETAEADGDPADNSVYGWNVDVYGDFAIGDEVPDESFGLQESEASFQWLDGVPSYIEFVTVKHCTVKSTLTVPTLI